MNKKTEKPHIAEFRVYEELNDFLPPKHRKKSFLHHFSKNPAIKDVIESLGIPHTEVDLILVNNQSVDFSYPLQNGDRVAVYPVFELLDITPIMHLRPKPLRKPKFILDVHLGKLAHYLRLLGFDTAYQKQLSDQEIIEIALQEKRIILTRDIGLLKNKRITHGHWMRATNPNNQVKEVLQKFDLYKKTDAFTRCLECNNLLTSIEKEKVKNRLDSKTRAYFDKFYCCSQCNKIYWEGSHYDKMKNLIAQWMGKEKQH